MSNLRKLFKYMEQLAMSDEDIPDNIGCKPTITALRECIVARRGKEIEIGNKDCLTEILDLHECQANYQLDLFTKFRQQIGIAGYNEYVQELEGKYGKEKATAMLKFPQKCYDDMVAKRVVWRVLNGEHPKGTADLAKSNKLEWHHYDTERAEMGEEEWTHNVKLVISEFGADKADKLFGLRKDHEYVTSAFNRVMPGFVFSRDDYNNIKTALQAEGVKMDGTDSDDVVKAAANKVFEGKNPFDIIRPK